MKGEGREKGRLGGTWGILEPGVGRIHSAAGLRTSRAVDINGSSMLRLMRDGEKEREGKSREEAQYKSLNPTVLYIHR